MRRLFNILIGMLSVVILSAHAEEVGFKLQTTSFSNQASLPVLYTCDGKDISPELDWKDIPENAKSFVLIMADLDAPGGTFYHWILYNIPKTLGVLTEGMSQFPTGLMVGKNSWGNAQYNGPCPPKDALHRYTFTLYVLDANLMLPAGSDAKTVINEMQNHIINKANLTVTYKR